MEVIRWVFSRRGSNNSSDESVFFDIIRGERQNYSGRTHPMRFSAGSSDDLPRLGFIGRLNPHADQMEVIRWVFLRCHSHYSSDESVFTGRINGERLNFSGRTHPMRFRAESVAPGIAKFWIKRIFYTFPYPCYGARMPFLKLAVDDTIAESGFLILHHSNKAKNLYLITKLPFEILAHRNWLLAFLLYIVPLMFFEILT